MSKTALKKQMKMLTADQLMEVILELYDARKDAREYLEYYVNPDEEKMLDRYRNIVLKEFFPAKGRAKARTSVCKKALKDFTTLHPSPRRIAELKLTLIESIMRYAANSRYWIRESHENTLTVTFRELLDYLYRNDLYDEFERRIDMVMAAAGRPRNPFREPLREIMENFKNDTGIARKC